MTVIVQMAAKFICDTLNVHNLYINLNYILVILCMFLSELLGPIIIQETNLVTGLVKLSTID